MQTRKIKVYTFDELSDEAKQKAIEKMRLDESYLSYDWWDGVYEEWTERLEKEGYNDVNISFTGFGSQGDGANFTASIDLEKWLKVAKKANKYRALYNFAKQYDIPTKIVKTYVWHYEHEMTIDIDTSDDYNMSDKAGKQLNEVEALLLEEARGYMKDIYRALEKEYDSLMSDESIAEMIRANEYEYTKEGNSQVYL